LPQSHGAGFVDDSVVEDLNVYREVSRVHKWNGRFGDLIRQCGGVLFFHAISVVQAQRLVDLQIGDFIFDGTSQREDGRWRASDIERYSREEQQRLQQALPAYEVDFETIKAESFVEPASELLTQANRKKTLLELIQEKRNRPRF
jgi:hypothetical protein